METKTFSPLWNPIPRDYSTVITYISIVHLYRLSDSGAPEHGTGRLGNLKDLEPGNLSGERREEVRASGWGEEDEDDDDNDDSDADADADADADTDANADDKADDECWTMLAQCW